MALLMKLDESNKALTARMDKMEQRPSLDSTPVIPRSHGLEHLLLYTHRESNHLPTLTTQAVTFQDTAITGDLNQRQQVADRTMPNVLNSHLTHPTGHTVADQLPSQSDAAGKMRYYPV